jgi:hypothetical protein
MALILEIRDRRGTVTWHRLGDLPMSLGRGLSNDVILDDPYVDGQHARIGVDDLGRLTIQDLGSVNGTLADGTRRTEPIPVTAGTEVRIGRTALRFRDVDEPVAPAFLESSQRLPASARWAVTGRGSAGLIGGATAATALLVWLNSTDRSNGSTVFAAVLAVCFILTIWAGTWALSLRGPDRRLHLRPHVAVASAGLLATLLFSFVQEWLAFLFPDVALLYLVQTAVVLLIVAAVIVGHLAVGGMSDARQRWRIGMGVSLGLLLIIALSAVVADDEFSDVPTFQGQLKPMPTALVPTKTVDEFVKVMAKARSEADKAIER